MAKKPLAALIVAKMGKKSEPEAMEDSMEDEVEPADDEGLNVAAEEAMAAIKADDVEGFKIALKSFFEQC